MPSTTYHPLVHHWVFFGNRPFMNEPENEEYASEFFCTPCLIALHTGDRIWVDANYAMVGIHPDILQVGDGHKGFDEVGNCIISIPASWAKIYLTVEEAEAAFMMIEIDAQLMAFARG